MPAVGATASDSAVAPVRKPFVTDVVFSRFHAFVSPVSAPRRFTIVWFTAAFA